MDNGKSTLIKSLDANLLSFILLLCCTAFVVLSASGYLWLLSLIVLGAAAALFFFDANYFVRKCCVQTACITAASIVLSLVFYLLGLISWTFAFNFLAMLVFRIINGLVQLLLAVPALLACIRAYSGQWFDIPFFGKYIDALCKKLGVF